MGDRGERPLVLFCVAVAALWAALAAAVARGAPPPPAPPLLGGGGCPPAAPELIDIDVSVWWYVYRTPAGAYAVGRDAPPGWVERFLLRSQADRYANRLNAGLEVKRRVRAAARAECCPPPTIYHAPPPAPVIVPFGAVQSILTFAPGGGGNFAGAYSTWPLKNRPARAAGMLCGPSG